MSKHNACNRKLVRQNLSNAKRLYPLLPKQQLSVLRDLTASLHLSVFRSELMHFSGKWYVSHSGLLRIAHRRRCVGIDTVIEENTTDASVGRWVFSHRSQIPIDELRRLWRRRSLQCFSPGPWRRDAGGRNPGGQPGPAQGLWHRHLLGRRNRLVCRTSSLSRESKKLPPQPVKLVCFFGVPQTFSLPINELAATAPGRFLATGCQPQKLYLLRPSTVSRDGCCSQLDRSTSNFRQGESRVFPNIIFLSLSAFCAAKPA